MSCFNIKKDNINRDDEIKGIDNIIKEYKNITKS